MPLTRPVRERSPRINMCEPLCTYQYLLCYFASPQPGSRLWQPYEIEVQYFDPIYHEDGICHTFHRKRHPVVSFWPSVRAEIQSDCNPGGFRSYWKRSTSWCRTEVIGGCTINQRWRVSTLYSKWRRSFSPLGVPEIHIYTHR